MKKTIILLITLWFWTLSAAAELSNIELNRHFKLDLLPADNSWTVDKISKQLKPIRFSPSPSRHTAMNLRKDFFNVKLYEINIICASDQKSVTSIELIFANKGDTKRKSSQQITKTNRILEKTLIKNFGQPVNSHFGTSKLRKRVKLWTFSNAKLILDSQNDEYVTIILMPADAEITSDSKQRVDLEMLKKNVATNDFGDHYIKNIPMIDQGDKGYCVPATVARIFAFYGFPDVSMHKLADIAETGKGGGTDVSTTLSSLNAVCKQKNIRIDRVEISVDKIAKQIDNGFPVVWIMFASKPYEEYRHTAQHKRKKIDNPERWARHLKKVKVSKFKNENPHACLIIGYNKITGELAVSNSWGTAENAPSWIPIKAAEKASQCNGFVLIPK